MARKTFISYKYDEAQGLRDKIIEKLGDDATYYQGETVDSPNLADTSTENIKENLKNMMYNTSVTIVIISPNLIKSNWIDWEIAYTLKKTKRGDKTSRTNGIVGVIKKINRDYDWMFTSGVNPDGCHYRSADISRLYEIINKNRHNRLSDKKYACVSCKISDRLEGSYMSLVKEEEFLAAPKTYIENAYDKSQEIEDFKLTKK